MASDTLVYVFLLCIFNAAKGITFCNKTSACSCMADDGLIDLSPLALKGAPRFKDVTGNYDSTYSWNPCYPFTEGDCVNVAVCKVQGLGDSWINIGKHASARFEVTAGILSLIYTVNAVDINGFSTVRTTSIMLNCDPKSVADFIAIGEDPLGSNTYVFNLASKYACMGAGGERISSLPVGGILLAVLASLLLKA